jgi:hypothetical protein
MRKGFVLIKEMDMMEYQIGPKAVRERVNNTRDGKTRLQALALEKHEKNNKKI